MNAQQIRETILASDSAAQREPLEIPEWGVTVYIRPMTAGEKDRWERGLLDSRGKVKPDVRIELALKVVVDEDGQPVFQREDLEALQKQAAKPISRIFDAASKLNGLSEDDIEEIEGN